MSKPKKPDPTTPDYHGLLSIPAGKSGPMQIRHLKHAPGFRASLNNLRTAFIGGQLGGKIADVLYDRATCWHQLYEQGGGVWMTDLPIEQQQHRRELAPIQNGRVLIGGLGLGLAVHILAPLVKAGKIRQLVVVEKSADVIALVEQATRRSTGLFSTDLLTIVRSDLFDFLRTAQGLREGLAAHAFDWAFYDIWASDGEETFFNTVLPLRALSLGVVRYDPICWNEDVMRGQLRISLQCHAALLSQRVLPASGLGLPSLDTLCTTVRDDEDKSAVFHNWRVPFFCWLRAAKPSASRVEQAAAFYANIYGLADWENTWRVWVGVEARTPR